MFKRLFIIACALWLAAGLVFGQRTWVRETDKEVIDMARPIWISTTGDWGATASWSTGVVPVSTDTVLFDGDVTNVSVTSGLDQSAIILAKLTVFDTYFGNIGLPGSPLQIASGQIIYNGNGTFFWSDFGVSAQFVVVDSANLVNAFDWVNSDGGALTNLYILSGAVDIREAVLDISLLQIDGENSILRMEPTSNLFRGVLLHSGTVFNSRGQSAGQILHVISGTWTQRRDLVSKVRNLSVDGGHFIDDSQLSLPVDSATVMGGVFEIVQHSDVKDIPILTIGRSGDVIKDPETTHSTRFIDLRGDVPILP